MAFPLVNMGPPTGGDFQPVNCLTPSCRRPTKRSYADARKEKAPKIAVARAGLVWMGYAYRYAPTIPLWGLLLGFRPVAYVLVLIALIFVVVGIATPSPTRVGMESKLAQGPDIARGMVRITRHPFLWGVALWALVHLIVNGDLASLILFGSLLVLALGGTAAIGANRRRSFGEHWMQ